ncbi:hypothetical protein PV327_001587 [Microctonus hyperodae]|uniref:DNA polymerase delta subunit 2 n=1 Tax=Microctonus hyperodae TaxID=165561 RepID=A0AA39FDT1_MICHY|nr:hypothetical protein PV327_001587 [Microctonus hyperodae]
MPIIVIHDMANQIMNKFNRECINVNDYGRFKIVQKSFDKQYSNIYNARLKALKDVLIEKAKQKWASHKILQLSELSEVVDDNELVLIVGIIYKHQELKPSILKELSYELQLIPQPVRSNYSSEKDQIFLEDEMMRIKLVGDRIDPKEIVTGLACTVLGHQYDDGTFWVEEYCFPGICPKASSSISVRNEKKQLLLLSGLNLCNDTNSIVHELLVEFISGMAGNDSTQKLAATITQVIIAGNCVDGITESYRNHGFVKEKNKMSVVALETILATHKFDDLLSQIAETCCVMVMPAQFDPSNHSIPQQPFHPCILPKTSRCAFFYYHRIFLANIYFVLRMIN